MKRLAFFCAAAAVLAAGLALASCGSTGSRPDESEAAPFRNAVADYLKRKRMGREGVRFKDLSGSDSGEAATASVVMKASDAVHNVTTVWEFTFRKKARATGGGRGGEESAGWEVETLERCGGLRRPEAAIGSRRRCRGIRSAVSSRPPCSQPMAPWR